MPEKRVYLLGGGGHGSVVLDALLKSGTRVSGILDAGMALGNTVFDVPVVGADERLHQMNPAEVLLANGIGATPGSKKRIDIFKNCRRRGFEFISACHPSALIGAGSILAAGSQVMAGTVLQCRVNVGENAVINTRASVDHDCQIGSHTFIGPGAVLCGDIVVGEESYIGAGATVLPGIKIGNGAIVGAGAVVIRNVPAGTIVVGTPATQTNKTRS